jgi:hypothetical protein
VVKVWHPFSKSQFDLEEDNTPMERLPMNYIRDLINHLRAGDSERRVARELELSRPTVHKYKVWAETQGYLDPAQPLPDTATLLAQLGPVRKPPQMISELVEYQPFIEQLLAQGVEMTAIWQRLQEDHHY